MICPTAGRPAFPLAPAALALAAAAASAQPCEPEWSPLGDGITGGVNALTVYQGHLYAGGLFTSASGVPGTIRVARWDGQQWLPVDQGLGGLVRTFLHHNGDLYVGGNFTTIQGGPAASRIARWDGASWSPVGSDVLNGQVMSMAVFNGELHAAGTFTSAGGLAAQRLVKWNGSNWVEVGYGLDSSVYALAVFDDGAGDGPALYVGGFFNLAGAFTSAPHIARWDGVSWSDVGGGLNGGVTCMTVYDDGSGPALYVGGNFTMAGQTPVTSIARWDGQNWSRVGIMAGEFTSFSVYALEGIDDGSGRALYAGGAFITADDQVVNRIAKWDGNTWSPVGGGVSGGQVNAIALYDDGAGPAIYVGGDFATAGGVTVNNIARWGCPPVNRCPADWDGNGSINSADISAFLASWLDSLNNNDVNADFDGSGSVNSADISAFLAAWLAALGDGGC